MNNHLLSLSFSVLFFPLHHVEKNNLVSFDEKTDGNYASFDNSKVLYTELNLSSVGLSEKAFEYAYRGYQYLIKRGKLNNTAILSICDLSQSSGKKRFFILDLVNNKVLMTTYVAHGRGSGAEYASRFSNNTHSHQSSLGFYITSSTYYGQHGLSLKLQGLEPGFNNLATKRNIVVHGASYIDDDHLKTNKFMGRSLGCPAVPQNKCAEIIDLIRDGTCLFVYYPAKKYLRKSKILNG